MGAIPDAEVVAALESMPGIGPWTSSIYLLMVLGRPDVWPVADIALAESVRVVKGLDERPGADAMTFIGEAWRPLRSVAARLLWHDYLARRGRTG
jgi:DNA-3-methyladenine glycosylase II